MSFQLTAGRSRVWNLLRSAVVIWMTRSRTCGVDRTLTGWRSTA